MNKQELQKILYKNYEPVKGLGADEIDIAIDQILDLLKAQKQELAKKIEKLPKYDLSKGGISGRYYYKKEDINQLLK